MVDHNFKGRSQVRLESRKTTVDHTLDWYQKIYKERYISFPDSYWAFLWIITEYIFRIQCLKKQFTYICL